jgi:hypothetical protein
MEEGLGFIHLSNPEAKIGGPLLFCCCTGRVEMNTTCFR